MHIVRKNEEPILCETTDAHEHLLQIVEKTVPEDEKLFDLAELFKVFGDSTRMKILFILFETEACTCGIATALNMTNSAVSHQLNGLKRAKLVKTRREGKSVYYALADEHVRTIIQQGMEHIEE